MGILLINIKSRNKPQSNLGEVSLYQTFSKLYKQLTD